jgi:hypothetical protein
MCTYRESIGRSLVSGPQVRRLLIQYIKGKSPSPCSRLVLSAGIPFQDKIASHRGNAVEPRSIDCDAIAALSPTFESLPPASIAPINQRIAALASGDDEPGKISFYMNLPRIMERRV